MAQSNAERQRLYRERKATGEIAPNRQHPPLTPGQRMSRWREMHPTTERDRRRQLKTEILTHYGWGRLACVKCGESRLACLSIDHIDGKGNRQRQNVALRASTDYYKWLKNNDYPQGLQTLCMNCQFVKRFERGEHN